MLAQSMTMLYATHVLLESMNLGVVLLVSTMALHALAVSCRALYGSNLYLELVWLLAPTVVVVLLIVRTIAMQCSDEELARSRLDPYASWVLRLRPFNYLTINKTFNVLDYEMSMRDKTHDQHLI